MKQMLGIAILIGMSLSLDARSWRVNNTPNSTADFNNLIEAHGAASDGDTLYIDGSPISYGELTITKQLTLIGPGYFLEQNLGTNLGDPAFIREIRLNPTINNQPSTGAVGTRIIGLEVRTVQISVNDVVVQKCAVEFLSILSGDVTFNRPATGALIIQNYIGRLNGFGSSTDEVFDFVATNNIIENITMFKNSRGTINHNLIRVRLDIEEFAGEFRSNILAFTRVPQNFPLIPSSLVSHNTTLAGQLGNENSNNTSSLNNLFINSGSDDAKWQLLPNSAASSNAHDGTDRGPFGGPRPYSLSGQAGRPAITNVELETPVVKVGENIKVKLTVQSND